MFSKEHHRKWHGAVPGEPGLNLPRIPERWWKSTEVPPAVLRQPRGERPKSAKLLAREKQRCHYCQLRTFKNIELYPVTITNTVDDTDLSPNFEFIESSILRDGVERCDINFVSGCECVSDHECQTSGCNCILDQILSREAKTKGDRTANAYVQRQGLLLLRDELLETRETIYECNSKCACSRRNCANSVVARGREVPLDIFKTRNRGWGVRSSVDIVCGQYIDKYVGEIITPTEADRRRAQSDVAQRKDVYLFALDKFNTPNELDERLTGEALEVDGEFMAGPTRFINHSCDPNLRIFATVGVAPDRHLHDLAFFATEDIKAGTELTFDYVDGQDEGLAGDMEDAGMKGQMTRCLCGTEACRGYLW